MQTRLFYSLNMSESFLARYAGKGFALDCLSNGVPMLNGVPRDSSYFQVKAGEIICKGALHFSGYALAATLVVLHLALLILPLGFVAYFFKQQRARQFRATPVLKLEYALAAMGIFSLASFGEIAQHIHDNWLFVGLIPSYNIAVFYGGLNFGQTLLAWGISGYDSLVMLDFVLSIATVTALLAGTVLTADGPQSTLLVWIVVFGALTVTSGVFMYKCFQTSSRAVVKDVAHKRFALAVGLSYVMGIASAAITAATGNQLVHIPTAAGFLAGFMSQVVWLDAILNQDLLPTAVPQRQHLH
jgi:hypothetical protein